MYQGLQTAAGLVGQANSAMASIQNIEAILQPLRLFNSFVTTLSNVHPYVQFALGILTGASQLLINQAKLDNEVSGLLNTIKDVYEFLMEEDTIAKIDIMKETLGKISQEIKDAAEFVIKYTQKKNFVVRIADSIVHDAQTIASAHVKNLSDLMQQYRDRTVRDVQVNMYRVLENLNLEGMAYAGDAGLNTTKKCLDGTRSEILNEITNWATDCDDKAPRILWLHGQAGRGKSAIAHTIASWAKDLGVLGSCFCFARDRQAERREGKILTTIARDLADRNPAFRRALSNIVSNDSSLKTTSDVLQQWKRFILDPLSEINGEMAGNIVVVIDAFDESGLPSSRKEILCLLASPEAAQLPFRILLTSRALPVIKNHLGATSHVKATSLDDVPLDLAERDIGLYVTKELHRVPGIGVTEIQNIVKRSSGLFEWARLACAFVTPDEAGQTPKERYEELMALESEEGRTLLDTTYFAILKGGIPQSGKRLERYRSVMHQIVMTLEPLPMTALDRMRKKFPKEEDRYDISLILDFMSPVLGGIMDCSPVRPLHASFYDFLMDESRSGVYCVATSDTKDLAFAALQALCDELRFNICGLESSYLANVDVHDLPERIKKNILLHLSYSCRFWGQHLEKSPYELALGKLVMDIIGSERIVFWLEAMSLLGVVGKGVDALTSVVRWLPKGEDEFEDMLAIAEDGIKLIQNFGSVMLHSTPHLYVSALPFIPSNALLSAVLLPKFSGLARVAVGGLRDWPAVQLLLEGVTSVMCV
ncbi:hypothetical protein EDD17DRAFT_1747892 [Pisolithus thermaeus]|nr:hypothetical protein EDD17DRAFT_1747892 [Pisolithus thermaeus]